MSPLLVAAVLSLLIYYLYRFAKSAPPNFPPGPLRLPVFGSYLQLLFENYKYPYKVIDRMTKTYKSKVLGFYLCKTPTIVVCDYEGVKEILTRPEFQGRIDSIASRTRALGKELGVFFVDGPYWLEQRRFALRHMRDYGFGRRSPFLEDVVLSEVQDTINLMQGTRHDEQVQRAGLTHFPDVLFPGFINPILIVLSGTRFCREDDWRLRILGNKTLQFQRSIDTTAGFLAQFPWLRYLAPKLTGFTDLDQGTKYLRDFMRDSLEEHKTSFSEDFKRDFIDVYIQQLRLNKDSQEPSTFSEDQLVLSTVDFLFPTASALAITIVFTLLHLMHNPQVCLKVQEELDAVVGRDRLPTLDDRPKLPYTEATLREAMRRTTLTPISLPHRATEDTHFRGYFVPKDTMMITCLWSMHMSKEFWGDPEAFRPERFLDDNGLLKKDYTLPFGAGKRLCAGETYSRHTLFLFLAGLLQNFTFELPKGQTLPDMDKHIPGIIETPKDLWLKAVPRA